MGMCVVWWLTVEQSRLGRLERQLPCSIFASKVSCHLPPVKQVIQIGYAKNENETTDPWAQEADDVDRSSHTYRSK